MSLDDRNWVLGDTVEPLVTTNGSWSSVVAKSAVLVDKREDRLRFLDVVVGDDGVHGFAWLHSMIGGATKDR